MKILTFAPELRPLGSREEQLETYRGYYGDRVTADTVVGTLKFTLIHTIPILNRMAPEKRVAWVADVKNKLPEDERSLLDVLSAKNS